MTPFFTFFLNLSHIIIFSFEAVKKMLCKTADRQLNDLLLYKTSDNTHTGVLTTKSNTKTNWNWEEPKNMHGLVESVKWKGAEESLCPLRREKDNPEHCVLCETVG
jgi:hypothetical protein